MKKITKERKNELEGEVSEIAVSFMKKYFDVITQPISNSFKAVEELGFFVISIPAPDTISGMTMSIDDKSMIVINSNQPLGRQNYSIWHEVYHWYTKDGQDISFHGQSEYSETEFKAEVFASEILIPRDMLFLAIEDLGKGNGIKYLSKKDIVILQNKFFVSYRAMLMRIISLTKEQSLNNRFGVARTQESIIKFNQECGFDGDLEKVESTPYISDSLFMYMQSNLSKGRVSGDRVETVLKFIEEEFK